MIVHLAHADIDDDLTSHSLPVHDENEAPSREILISGELQNGL